MTFGSFSLLFGAGVMIIGGCAAGTYFGISVRGSWPQRLFEAYAARLDRYSSFLLVPYRGFEIARAHAVACIGIASLSAMLRSPVLAFSLVPLAVAPLFLLRRRQGWRVARLESQLDTWLLMLANALKATPSVGEAVSSTVTLVSKPFSEEVDLLVKEIRLGTPLDRAVNALARRINSDVISGALATIVVARRTGGNLSLTLERAAAALRESARLEGVLRTKTAEGRGQVVVLASVPFALCAIIAWLEPSWFDPMLDHTLGRGILVACAVTWTVASLWAHQIAKADI